MNREKSLHDKVSNYIDILIDLSQSYYKGHGFLTFETYKNHKKECVNNIITLIKKNSMELKYDPTAEEDLIVHWKNLKASDQFLIYLITLELTNNPKEKIKELRTNLVRSLKCLDKNIDLHYIQLANLL